jgi:hypothetical protein
MIVSYHVHQVSVYAKEMTDSPYNRLERISGLLGIAVPACLFVALKRLRGPKIFLNLSGVACQIQEDCDRQLAELMRAQSELIRRPHIEMIALTLLAVALLFLCLLSIRTHVPKWTKYLLMTSVVASLAACWLQW